MNYREQNIARRNNGKRQFEKYAQRVLQSRLSRLPSFVIYNIYKYRRRQGSISERQKGEKRAMKTE